MWLIIGILGAGTSSLLTLALPLEWRGLGAPIGLVCGFLAVQAGILINRRIGW
jgi:hypothetical protein